MFRVSATAQDPEIAGTWMQGCARVSLGESWRIKAYTPIFTCVSSYAESRHSYMLDVRLSVRLSHAGIVSKRLNIIVMLSSPYDSPFILVLCISRPSRNSDGVTPCGAAKQRWGKKMSQFSTNNLLYLRNG